MKPEELKTLIEALRELGSTCGEATEVLSGAAREASYAKLLWGKCALEQERAKLVKIGLEMMHFPGLVPSIFLDELFHQKLIGTLLVAIGLIQEKRSPMHTVKVYEEFQKTTQKLLKITDKAV